MNIDIQSLLDSADWWEKAGYAASAVVVIGILIESIELAAYIRAGKLREKRFELIGLLVLIFGLAGEILTQVQSNNRTGLVIGALNAKASEANEVANKAASKAADLGVKVDELPSFVARKKNEVNDQIDNFNKSTSEKKKQTDKLIASLNVKQKEVAATIEAAKKDEIVLAASANTITELRQQLHDLTTPRLLTDAQISELAGKLDEYPKIPFDLLVAQDSDSENLVARIGALLEKAGWLWKPAPALGDIAWNIEGKPRVSFVPAQGFKVVIAESSRPTLEKPVLSLVNGLISDGIKAEAIAEPDLKMNPLYDRLMIHVMVGSK